MKTFGSNDNNECGRSNGNYGSPGTVRFVSQVRCVVAGDSIAAVLEISGDVYVHGEIRWASGKVFELQTPRKMTGSVAKVNYTMSGI